MSTPTAIHQLTDHLFRHESGKMIAVLTNIFGLANLETAEDVVQQTFITAIEIWRLKGIPENPAAWLMQVAKRKTIDQLRKSKFAVQYDFSSNERKLLTSEYTMHSVLETYWQEQPIKDDMLRMMYSCCTPDLSPDFQITLILKTLCGFSIAEIAHALLSNEETISKRLQRAKHHFRNKATFLQLPLPSELHEKTAIVLNCIYLLFNEGYHASSHTSLIREDLMQEALLLGKLLAENPLTALPEVNALMALMCFHASRSESRLTKEGAIILLHEQDRTLWNNELIDLGKAYMHKATVGEHLSAYHIEAAIAFEHCSAKTFELTNWSNLLRLYDWLIKIDHNPINFLNRAIVLLQLEGPQPTAAYLAKYPNQNALQQLSLYFHVLAEIDCITKDSTKALHHYNRALALSTSKAEQQLIQKKIIRLQQKQQVE